MTDHNNDIGMGKANLIAYRKAQTVPTSGVVGGIYDDKNKRTLYVNKSNYKPPTGATKAQIISSILDGTSSYSDKEFYSPVPITLAGIRKWCEAHVEQDNYSRKDGSKWTAPACTVGILRYRDNGKIAGFIPCNSWSCPVCGPIKRNRLTDKVIDVFDTRKERTDCDLHHITLNLRVPAHGHTINDPRPMLYKGYPISGYVPQEKIAECFQRFRSNMRNMGYFNGPTGKILSDTTFINSNGTECRRIRRELLDTDDCYFYVKEFSPPSGKHKSGVVTAGSRRHYHILTNFYVPTEDLRRAWWYATKKTSANVKITSATESQGKVRASYITKYINKSMSDETFINNYLPRERRYGKTVGLFTMKFESKGLCYFQALLRLRDGKRLYSSAYDMARITTPEGEVVICTDDLPTWNDYTQHPLS